MDYYFSSRDCGLVYLSESKKEKDFILIMQSKILIFAERHGVSGQDKNGKKVESYSKTNVGKGNVDKARK